MKAGAPPLAPETMGDIRMLPSAGGQPVSDATAEQAAEWLTLLMSGDATGYDRQCWQQWRAANPEHERAWAHIEAVINRLKALDPKAAYQVLSPGAAAAQLPTSKSPRRRKVAGMLLWAGSAGAAGLLGSRTGTWQQLAAEHRTRTGEQRTVSLEDGTRVTLNTGSALSVRFDSDVRLLRLLAGEVLIVTAHAATGAAAADPRPLIVETDAGRIRALGTRFTVRRREKDTGVAVLENAVAILPAEGTGEPWLARAGQRISFTRSTIFPAVSAGEQDAAWSRGQIVADNVRLADFLTDLGRYRSGIIRCDPAVADLRFSGVFPLNDTDRILASLPEVLAVQVQQRTRYWVNVGAAP
jgi:transmembrane sensor